MHAYDLTDEETLELRDRWAAALRSGDYEQGNGKLRDGNKWCCLGVLGDLLVRDGLVDGDDCWEAGELQERGELPNTTSIPRAYFPRLRWPNDPTTTWPQDILISMNDEGGRTFAEIADAVETLEVVPA